MGNELSPAKPGDPRLAAGQVLMEGRGVGARVAGHDYVYVVINMHVIGITRPWRVFSPPLFSPFGRYNLLRTWENQNPPADNRVPVSAFYSWKLHCA